MCSFKLADVHSVMYIYTVFPVRMYSLKCVNVNSVVWDVQSLVLDVQPSVCVCVYILECVDIQCTLHCADVQLAM